MACESWVKLVIIKSQNFLVDENLRKFRTEIKSKEMISL